MTSSQNSEQTYFRIAHALKPEISRLMETRTGFPLALYFGSYWGENFGILGQFNVLFETQYAMERAKPLVSEITREIERLFRDADVGADCGSYRFGVEFWYVGQPGLPPLYRED